MSNSQNSDWINIGIECKLDYEPGCSFVVVDVDENAGTAWLINTSTSRVYGNTPLGDLKQKGLIKNNENVRQNPRDSLGDRKEMLVGGIRVNSQF